MSASTRSTWADYDEWEARDRTLLEAFATARERELGGGYVIFEEYGTRARPGTFLRDALANLDPVRYPPPSPAEELPLDL